MVLGSDSSVPLAQKSEIGYLSNDEGCRGWGSCVLKCPIFTFGPKEVQVQNPFLILNFEVTELKFEHDFWYFLFSFFFHL